MLLGSLIVADKLLINLAVNCKKSAPIQQLLTFQLLSYCGSGKPARNNSQVLPCRVCKHVANSQIALMYSLIAPLNLASYLLCTEVHF